MTARFYIVCWMIFLHFICSRPIPFSHLTLNPEPPIPFSSVTQDELDLDVYVHGEPERNDMVQFFGERLDGYVFTTNAWVQSYGSRCVRPPIIVGDVSRPAPMTVKESR